MKQLQILFFLILFCYDLNDIHDRIPGGHLILYKYNPVNIIYHTVYIIFYQFLLSRMAVRFRKNKYLASGITSRVVWIYFVPNVIAACAPIAVAVSAKPIKSSLSPSYFPETSLQDF